MQEMDASLIYLVPFQKMFCTNIVSHFYGFSLYSGDETWKKYQQQCVILLSHLNSLWAHYSPDIQAELS